MFLFLFLCWIVFNQAFTLEIAIFGVIICGAIYFFACKFMDYSIKKDLFIVKKLPRILQYIVVLVWEVLKANATLLKLYVTKRKNREPVIVTFRTKLRTRVARVFLANAITLTPGTITVELEDDKYTVHCYDKSLAKGLDNTIFEQKLLKLEEGF